VNAPAVVSRPAPGTEVTVSSTRRDKDGVGRVVTCDDIGIRIRVDESARERFYPWGQVAFVEWVAGV
jgi:hypothetical protein